LVVVNSIVQRQEISRHAEVWIYKGGPAFQVDTPMVIIRDPEENTNESTYGTTIADLDGDDKLDLIVGGQYTGGSHRSVWWGSATSPWSWGAGDSLPDRTIPVGGWSTLDCDGDGALDFMFPGPDNHVYLFRSHVSGKSARTRSFTLDDADQSFYRTQARVPLNLGYLNDATHRYQMPGIAGVSPSGQSSMLMGFASGPEGPDHSYEAFYAADLDGLIEGNVVGTIRPISDCNGDGWDDVLTSNFSWPGQNWGIALVLAGGPEIPRDPSSGVRQISLEEKSDAISVWPNPARDVVNIAWRGDLKKMPRRFVVHDMVGREIAHGEVPAGSGAARWQCGDLPSGVYLVSIYDERGNPVATTRVVKR
jgi:hypothetical protein